MSTENRYVIKINVALTEFGLQIILHGITPWRQGTVRLLYNAISSLSLRLATPLGSFHGDDTLLTSIVLLTNGIGNQE